MSAGTIEEYVLGAVALAHLLTGDVLPGLSDPPTTVALQRRVAGHTLDDLVLRSGSGAAEIGIDFQIKRTASPTASNKAFVDALGQCVETLSQQRKALAAGRLLLGIGASGPRGPPEQLQRLTEIARSHAAAATFLGVLIPGVTAQDVRTRYGHVRPTVAEVTKRRGQSLTSAELDALTYELSKYLRVWIFEVGDDGRDVLYAQSRLATILPPGGQDPHDVFSQLRTLAESWGPNAGFIDAPMLRAALNVRGIPLTADPRHRMELGRVLDASRQELARTVDQMGGRLRLERARPGHALEEAWRATAPAGWTCKASCSRLVSGCLLPPGRRRSRRARPTRLRSAHQVQPGAGRAARCGRIGGDEGVASVVFAHPGCRSAIRRIASPGRYSTAMSMPAPRPLYHQRVHEQLLAPGQPQLT